MTVKIQLLSTPQVRWFTGRLLLFWSKRKAARAIGVTEVTLNRWMSGETLAPSHQKGKLERALYKLHKQLVAKSDKAKIYWKLKDVADALINTDEYPTGEVPIKTQTDAGDLTDFLIGQCTDTEVRSTDIFDWASKNGFTRQRVYRAARKLGVEMTVIEKGRNGYSLWHLDK